MSRAQEYLLSDKHDGWRVDAEEDFLAYLRHLQSKGRGQDVFYDLLEAIKDDILDDNYQKSCYQR